MRRVVCCAALTLSLASSVWAQTIPAEYQEVLAVLGRQADYQADVLEVNIPRNDVSVTVAGVKTPTAFGFGGWVAMTKGTGTSRGYRGTGPAATLAAGFKAALNELAKPRRGGATP